VIFRQLFEPLSSTYTYLLADADTREAVLIDPVIEELEAYVALLAELGLTLRLTLETHLHADHVTAAASLRDRLGSKVGIQADAGASGADLWLRDGDVVRIGSIGIEVRATPGHTDGCVSYHVGDRVFTGDALLIGGCGRTDFQQGSAERLHESVTTRIFTLPDDTLVYPAHDYRGRTVSTVKEERGTNARLGGGRTREEFVAIMAALALPRPKQIDRALPANQRCGRESEP
jgi:glyoxylase-like metal-dependent hydrolase (beta-lactamase superfamily II)